MSQGYVLIVDDDPDIRDVLQMVVEGYGYHCVGAGDGLEALQRIRELGWPRMIVLDLRMPRMNGIEFLTALRKEHGEPHVPVVVMSGDTASASLTTQAGGDGYLPKPVDVDELIGTVEAHAGAP